jgi:hypothetical protein
MYQILNENLEFPSEMVSVDPIELSKHLEKVILKLKGDNFIIENQVDYNRLVKSSLFIDEYLKLAHQLKYVNLNELKNDDEKLAFFISIPT